MIRMRVALATGAILLATAAAGQPLDLDRRADDLVSRMTLSERIGQLDLVPNNPGFDRAEVEAGRVGGVLAFTGGRDIAAVQEAARRSRLGVPLLVGLDILHGTRTMFPLPLAEAASFDPGLARETATAAAREAARLGINWTFAPMVDLARDPRWGRMIEGFGEDPHVGALFAAAKVRGFREGGLATTLKHFAGYGAAFGGRDYDAAEIPTGDLHDSYLPAFRAGIDAGAESVMSAFHALNGVPATANPRLTRDILRTDWRYGGFTVSDWLAIAQLQDHGVAGSPAEAARKAMLAGVDMDMASGLYARHLPAEVAAGRVPEGLITEAARRVVRAKLAMGLFASAEAARPLDPATRPPSAETRALARRAAADTIVLLRNDGALPLAPGRTIALVGGMASNGQDIVGPHAALVRWEDGVTLLDGLRRRAGEAGSPLAYVPGCDAGCGSPDGFDAAIGVAAASDVVVAVLGEPLDLTGEAASRARLTLPGRGAELLGRLVATGKPVVLVLLASRPIELGPVVDRLAGLLMAWFPGTEGGNALADILFGDVLPSAKLPVSWPRTIGQVPLTYDRLPSGRPPDPKNRFTLRYVDEETTPLFPFGFGLSYTRFALSDLRIAPLVAKDGIVEARVTLANAGDRRGSEVVQLYVRKPVAAVSRPLLLLKAFAKVALRPGEAREVVLRVPVTELGYTREDGTYVVEPGGYEAFVGTRPDATLRAVFDVAP